MRDAASFLKWEITRKGAKVTGCLKTIQGDLAIPSTLDGREVYALGDGAFSGCVGLESVALPRSALQLGRRVFQGCKSLQSVELPEGLREIPPEAFERCLKLTGIRLPESLTVVGARAFLRCHLLANVSTGDRLATIETSAFEKCASLRSFILPDSVVEVGDSAFADCSSLNLFVIPEHVAKLGAGALAGCVSLADVKLFSGNPHFSRDSDGVLFSKDHKTLLLYPAGKKDESYTTPDETFEIGARAFAGARALGSVALGSATTTIGDGAFRKCATLETVALGSATTRIGAGAFEECASLKRIRLPEGLSEIAPRAFGGCSALAEIKFPSTVKTIGDGAFEDCSSIRELVITDGVERVGADAFNGCSALQKLVIPPSVATIGDSAFEDCAIEDPGASLRGVDLPEGVREIGAWSFSDESYIEYVSIPASLAKIGPGAFAFCSNLQAFDVDQDNPGYSAFEETLYTKDGSTLLAYPCGKMIRRFRAPEWCHAIAPNAFSLAVNLRELELHDKIATIGRGAFSGSGLQSLALPDAIDSIPDDAFWGCSRLETIRLPGALTSIGDRAFRGCAALKEITLPETLVSIGDEAFFGCASLESIRLPAALQEARGLLFAEATNLADVGAAPESSVFLSNDGVLFSRSGLELLFFPPAKNLSEYEVPPGVATIAVGAFQTPRYLARLKLPASVSTIEDGAIDRKRVKLLVPEDSYALNWARRNRRNYETYRA